MRIPQSKSRLDAGAYVKAMPIDLFLYEIKCCVDV
jgi:hypothetical protein